MSPNNYVGIGIAGVAFGFSLLLISAVLGTSHWKIVKRYVQVQQIYLTQIIGMILMVVGTLSFLTGIVSYLFGHR